MLKTFFAAVVVAVVAAAAPAARAAPLAIDLDLLADTARTVIDVASSSSQPELALLPMLPVLDLVLAQSDGQKSGGGGGPPQLSGVGVGIQVGFPVALTVKIGAAQQNGLIFGIGTSFGYYNRFQPYLSVHGEYQLHLFTLVRNGTVGITGYFAPGLWLSFFGDGRYGFYDGYYYARNIPFGVAIRATFGVSMLFAQAPVEVYLELTPALYVFPGLYPAGGWSLGFRYYF